MVILSIVCEDVRLHERELARCDACCRETSAAVVHPQSGEKVIAALNKVEIVTSRATASLLQLIGWSQPLLQRGATGLFLKGRTVQQEIDSVSDAGLDFSTLPSRTDSSGRIVSVRYKKQAIC